MKATPALRRFLLASTLLVGTHSAQAQLYWDTNGTTDGFGTASGTWGTDAFWNDDATGSSGNFTIATTTTDTLNFGTATDGLATGTISVSGTVDSGDMAFGSASGAITLSGGFINFANAATITVNNTTNTIGSVITGASTSLTIDGTGTLVLTGTNTYTGNTIINSGTLSMASNLIANSAKISINGGATLAGTDNFFLASGQAIEGTGTGIASFNTGTSQSLITAGNNTISHTGTGTLTFQRFDIRGTGNEMTGGNVESGVAAPSARRGLLVGNSADGTFTISGGTFTSIAGSQGDTIGTNGAFGTFNINGGNYVNTTSLSFGVGATGSHLGGTLNVTSGSATIGTLIYNSVGAGNQGIINLNGGTLTLGGITYTRGDNRQFNFNGGQFIASGNLELNNTITMSVQNGGANINTNGNTVTVSGNLVNAGTGGLSKSGAGTLILSGTNTYVGMTTISAGTLEVLGSIANSSSITNDAALLFNSNSDQSYANGISGTGTLSKSGTGTLTLSGTNTYTGDTIVNAGTLAMASNVIQNSSNIFIAGGATFAHTANDNFTLANGQNLFGTGTGTATYNNTAAVSNRALIASGNNTIGHTGTGTLKLQRLQVQGTGVTMTGGNVESGLGTGSGLSYRGLVVGNSTHGEFTITGGTLTTLGTGNAGDIIGIGSTTGTLNIDGGSYISNSLAIGAGATSDTFRGGTLNINSGSATIGTFIYNFSSTAGRQGIINLNGGTLTLGGITSSNGANRIFNFNGGQFVASGAVNFVNTIALNVQNGGAKIDTGSHTVTVSGNLVNAGTGGLTKSGAGTLILSGTNTYVGATSVNEGVLQINSTGALNGTSQINLGTTTGTTLRLNAQNLTITKPIHTANAGQTSTILGVFNTGDNSIASVSTIGQITGAGNVLFSNVGTSPSNMRFNINLNAASNYTGTTTIDSEGGQNTNLILGINNALPTGTVLTFANTAGAGTGRQMNFDLNGFNQTLGGLAAIGSQATRIIRVHNTNATAATLTINDNSNRTFRGSLGTTGASNTSAGNNFGIVKNGTGTWTLQLSTFTDLVNSYTGGTILNQGGITLGDGATLGTGSLQVNNTNSTGPGTDVLLTLATGSDLTVGSLSGTIATPSSGTNTATIATQSGRSLIVNQTANATFDGVISGAGDFTLGASSTHTLTLSGTNTHSGATTVSAGTLYVSGALASSAVTVMDGGTIGSSGTLGNGLTIEAGGKLDLTGATIGLNSTDILTITGGTLTLDNFTFQDIDGWNWQSADVGTYELIAGTFDINWGSTAYRDASSAYDFGNGLSGYFTSGSLTVVIIPEPGVALLGGLSLLILLRRRRS